jgi:hypothetical protein
LGSRAGNYPPSREEAPLVGQNDMFFVIMIVNALSMRYWLLSEKFYLYSLYTAQQ